ATIGPGVRSLPDRADEDEERILAEPTLQLRPGEGAPITPSSEERILAEPTLRIREGDVPGASAPGPSAPGPSAPGASVPGASAPGASEARPRAVVRRAPDP